MYSNATRMNASLLKWKIYSSISTDWHSQYMEIAIFVFTLPFVAQMQRRICCFFCTYVQEQLFPCFDKETQTTAFIYCYIDTVVGLSIVKFHIFAVKRKQLELWKALTIL
jgi:hypothetical protein